MIFYLSCRFIYWINAFISGGWLSILSPLSLWRQTLLYFVCCLFDGEFAVFRNHALALDTAGCAKLSFLCRPCPTDVIHTVGPVARVHVGPTETNDLTSCYQNSLRLMKEHGLSTVVSTAHGPRSRSSLGENCLRFLSRLKEMNHMPLCLYSPVSKPWARAAAFENFRKFGKGTRTKGFNIFHFFDTVLKSFNRLYTNKSNREHNKMVMFHVCQMKAFLCSPLGWWLNERQSFLSTSPY